MYISKWHFFDVALLNHFIWPKCLYIYTNSIHNTHNFASYPEACPLVRRFSNAVATGWAIYFSSVEGYSFRPITWVIRHVTSEGRTYYIRGCQDIICMFSTKKQHVQIPNESPSNRKSDNISIPKTWFVDEGKCFSDIKCGKFPFW